ncbi:hypothetical protein HDE_01859 [Halotydeus destructor]|nr:hypothetical protein HDE_01859 [Halotydeus destructor]
MGYAATKDQFVSIVNAIEAMPMYRKQRIAAYVQDIVDQLDHSDLVILTQLAISVATGGPEAILRHQVLGRLARNACDYIRNQVAEEQAINPDFLRQ